MDRLTKKDGANRNIIEIKKFSDEDWIISEMADGITIKFHSKAIDKLAEFEDFMEKCKFESLEDFQNSIGFIRFSDGYDDNGNEMHKQEFVKYLDAYQERVKYSKKLYQDKKQLQDRWEQLKKFTKDKISCLSKMDGLGAFVVAYELILDKIQELEKE